MSSLMGTSVSGVMVMVQIEGAPLDPLVAGNLIKVEVATDIAIADEITLWFSDPDPLLSVVETGGLIIGAIVTVEADEVSGLPDPWIMSICQITGIETRLDHYGRTTIVHALDRSHAMMRGRQSMSWPPGDLSEPVEALAGKAGLIPFVIPTGVESLVFVSQANQSDWEFVQQLARETNSLCFVRQETLYFIPPGMPLPPSGLLDPEPTPPESAAIPLLPGQLYFGVNLTRLSTTVRAADQVGTVIVPGVDPLAPDVPVPGIGVLMTDLMDNLEQPMEVGALVEADDAMFVYTDVPFDVDAVEQAAMSFGERLANAYCEIDGETNGTAWLTAGINVGIGGTGLTTDGMYMVTSARHVITDVYKTEFTCSGIRDVTFGGLANSEWQQTKRHLIHGVVTGIVTAVGDPEDPGAPKVQLMFPWLSVEYLSPFAPVCQPGGAFSPAFSGNILTPMVGQEVLVAFDRGDIRAPYVLGGLYNGINEAMGPLGPVVTEDLVLGQVYMSQTGHTLTFSDDPAAPMILLQSNDEMLSIMMAVEEGAITIQNTPDVTITMMATGEIMVSGGSLTIMGEESISIMAPDITIAGEASVTITGADVTVEGDATVGIAAAAITIGPG